MKKIYKTGEEIKYTIPCFSCTKCGNTQLTDPGFIFLKNNLENKFVASLIENCSQCGNDEFTLTEFEATLGLPASHITKK